MFDRETCIGAVACAMIAPEYWKIAPDQKVDLEKSKQNKETGKYELIITTEKEYSLHKDAEHACPVAAIKVIKLENQI